MSLTIGRMMLYGGILLAALTGALAVLFAVKKPEYRPEDAAKTPAGDQNAAAGKTPKDGSAGS